MAWRKSLRKMRKSSWGVSSFWKFRLSCSRSSLGLRFKVHYWDLLDSLDNALVVPCGQMSGRDMHSPLAHVLWDPFLFQKALQVIRWCPVAVLPLPFHLPKALDLGGELGPVPEYNVLVPHAHVREDYRNLLKNRTLRDTGGGLNCFHMLSPVTNISWAGWSGVLLIQFLPQILSKDVFDDIAII